MALPSYLHRRYRVLQRLGAGGLATAYRVWDEATEEERALKVVDARAVERLRQEFALLVGLFHPRVVRVHDFGVFTEQGESGGFYTADLLVGVSLATFAAAASAGDTRRALADALEGLAFLHRLGIRHGDFKPDNVIVDAEGRATLLDLSCASRLANPITDISGTPGFIPPELAVGKLADARADLFAVGVTLEHLFGPRPEPEVAALVARLTDPDPRARPAEVVDALAALGESRTLLSHTSARSPTLLGRDEVVASFDAMFRALLSDEPGPRVLVIDGPAGSGKSRLLDELKWKAELASQVTEAARPSSRDERSATLAQLMRRAGANLASQTHDLDALLGSAAELSLGGAPHVLLVDAADELDAVDGVHLEAMLRSLPSEGRLLVVATARRALIDNAPSVVTHHLGPLSLEAIATWAGSWVPPGQLPLLLRFTGGHPAYLEATIELLANGALVPEELAAASSLGNDGLSANEGIARAVRAMSAAEQAAMARVVASGGWLPHARRDALQPLALLAANGWLLPESDGFRLARPVERLGIERALPASTMAAAYRGIATTTDDPATAVSCWVALGELGEARRIFLSRASCSPASPRRWSDAIDALARACHEARLLLAVGTVQLGLGRPHRALSALARMVRGRPSRALAVEAWALAGSAYLQLERPRRATRFLRRALEHATHPATMASALVRALNQIGSYAEAAELAEHHLAACDEATDGVAIALANGLGVASTYLGHTAVARQHLELAAAHIDETQAPRDAARTRSYLAIVVFREGAVEQAAAHYQRALDIAERHQLSDMLPTLLLNLGTARQQLGTWGDAIALYERGHRLAVALGKTHARSILELNLANLYADIGLTDRAAVMLTRSSESAALARIEHLEGQRHTIEAEIAIARDDRAAAAASFERARDEHARRDEPREAAEASVHAGAMALALGLTALARRHLRQAEALLGDAEASDVSARMAMTRGLVELAEGNLDAARDHGRSGLIAAETGSQPLVIAEAVAALARVEAARGNNVEAAAFEERARGLWQEVLATLPRAMQDAFWRHPRRRALAPTTVHGQASSGDAERLRRVLELSARVGSTLALDRVLELAMDAAIELSGAERGFLLLDDRLDAKRPVQVAVARNLDRERLGRGELEFSTSIAEQVLRSGDAVVTLDARGDARFSDNRSVHAMRLKSVVCVPVAAQGVVLGALYLDNRYEPGRFQEHDIGVVLAFANHIAMAVENARLHAALEENHRRLAAEKRQVERLSRGQARQIQKLEERVETQQRVLERRYDYAAISHESRSMSAVLAVLDRVIESDLTVLIEGESGTGKELIARAVHFNSSRKDLPFVGVNCGAIAETLLESELFGHTEGAFTGADRDREGLIVAAHGGTLFLDEIGELSLAMQVKLLRVLQEREVRPLGSEKSLPIDVRVVCATNRHLRDEVSAGRFREDLFYRIGVVEVVLPPLREREEDILPIARRVLARQAEKVGREPPEMGRDAVRALLGYRWPGNVRELENVLTRAYVLSDRVEIGGADLDLSAKPRKANKPITRGDFERGEAERIHDTLLANRWNVSRTARALGMPRNTLYRRMQRFGIAKE